MKNFAGIMLAILLAPLVLTSCASIDTSQNYMDDDGYAVRVAGSGKLRNPAIHRVIWQDQFRNVMLVEKEAGEPNNDHPKVFPSKQLKTLLLNIQASKKGERPDALFEEDDLEDLINPLADALAAASPEEDIVFHITQKRGLGLLLSEKKMTTGRLFVRDGQINIIFGNIQQSFETRWLQGGGLKLFVPGSRTNNTLKDWALVSYQNTKTRDQRNDWILLSIDTPTISQSESKAVTQPVILDAASRLEALKALKDKGLITEEEFQKKRTEILNQL